MTKTITFVIRQPGTANAFIPLIKELDKQKGYRIITLAFDLSHALLKTENLIFHKIEKFDDALEYLAPSIDFLVTGTSEKVADDQLFWKWAAENQIPSLAYVDQWSNLTQRFECQNLPAHIGVLDNMAQQELNTFIHGQSVKGQSVKGQSVKGQSQVHVLGSPVFDVLKTIVNSPVDTGSEKRILFVLEPDISGLNDDEIRRLDGFTEYDCLRAGFAAVCDYMHHNNRLFHFYLKPHPRDNETRIEALVEKLQLDVQNYPIQVWAESKQQALIQADIIMGIRSMLLLEAAYVQKPVISIQLNRTQACALTDDRDYITLAVTEEDIELSIDHILKTPISPNISRNKNTDIQTFSSIERFKKILQN